ncbi:hypothetical protein H8356DRAFT_1706297 [Neocallimastix lanati (nom. inval.)]|nr:hypothetical protein H8356DRAFT_1706297 [Neocallimastix sp. JGI-2020a]
MSENQEVEQQKVEKIVDEKEQEQEGGEDFANALFGVEGERNMFQSLVFSIFNEGIDDNVHLFIRIVFGGLFFTVFSLLFITNFNIHVCVLFVITTLLCVSLEWWLHEWNIEKENQIEEEKEDGEMDVEEEKEEKKTK